uniref:NADH-ubiquinone oxidoreductase chain 6 n=1 Tax=Deracantha onos TaxID=441219 RepID=B8PSA3_DERON|nr:NADH dehydrogenase subunit 6 [Deracantha onos]ABV23674.1 NADH dehydrogenase subunit 6 [Deracantha onos]
MLNLIMLTCYIFNALMFIQTNHPMVMTLIVIIQTFIAAMYLGLLSLSYWFCYILTLAFLGGMLVLFLYITSLASNEFMFITSKMISTIILLMITLSIFVYTMDPWFHNILTKNTDTSMMDLINSFDTETTPHLLKLYNKPNHLITLLLVNYLFLTLIIVVKITNIFQGPLRQKF